MKEVNSLSSRNAFDADNFVLFDESPANPGAGADLSTSAPVNARAELVVVGFELVTDVNAANRYIYLQRDRAGTRITFAHSYLAHIASTSATYIGHSMAPISLGSIADAVFISLPGIPFFLEGDTIFIRIRNVQVGDQLSSFRLMWKIWPFEQ